MTHRGIHLDGRSTVAPTPGPAPMLQWLAVDRLVIDDDYQRPLGRWNWLAIEKIASHFHWSRFSPVLVAPVAGGLFAVIDGQHRVHAAALCGMVEVPAMVVQVDLAAQATAFALVNSQTIKVTGFHIYKAALAAGEDWAVRSHAAVTGAGCVLMTYNSSSALKKPGEVYCLALIRKLVEAGQDRAITAGLAAIRAVPGLDRPVVYSDFMLRPWLTAVAEAHCPPVPVLTRALTAQSPFKVIERATATMGAGHNKATLARTAMLRQIMDAGLHAGGDVAA